MGALPGTPKRPNPRLGWVGQSRSGWAGHGHREGLSPTPAHAHAPVITVSCNGSVRTVLVTFHHSNRGIATHLRRQCSQVQTGV